MKTITLGCDPELALYDTRTDEMISAIGRVPGVKGAPHPVEGSTVGLAIHPDNVSLEFNISPTTPSAFHKAISTAICEVEGWVKKNISPTVGILYGDSFQYKEADLKVEGAITIGCDRDQLAHERGEYRKPPSIASMGRNRMFGGHIHVGYDIGSVPIPDWAVVQGFEALGYVPEILMLGYDMQQMRRKFYGMGGLFRSKTYGFEYRTPTSNWCRSPRLVANAASVVPHIISKPRKYQEIWVSIDFMKVQALIASNGEMRGGDVLLATLRDLRRELVEAEDEEEAA